MTADQPQIPRRRHNWEIIERLEQDNAALRENAQHDRDLLANLYERYDAAQLSLADAHQRLANQAATIQAECATAEWAVAEAWGARRELSDHASSVTVAYLLVGASAIIVWEVGWSVVHGLGW